MNQKTKAIFFILCSAFGFGLMSVFVRLAGDLPSMQKSFFRNLVALFFALFVLLRSGEKLRWNPGNLPLLLVRSICGTVGILCNFYAIDHLVLSDASMLNKLSPFFAILFSFLFLREKIQLVQILSILAAFCGALLIIKPSFALSSMFAPFIGVLGGLGAGAAYTAVRALGSKGERGPFIVFFFSTFSCLSTLPYLVFDFHPMSLYQLGMLLLAGLSATLGQFSITAAYTYAPAREISIYDYMQVVFTALFGFFIFGQIPDLLSVLGYFIICGVSLCMFLYNKRQWSKTENL